MELTYNGIGQSNATNLVTFTDIPNILKLTDTPGGYHATISLEFEGNITNIPTSSEVSITIFGETITGVRNASEAINKNFYMSSSPVSTAASVAKALRNCATIVALFTVEHSDEEVELRARNAGQLLQGVDYFSMSSSLTSYVSKSAYDGSASVLNGSLVNVEVLSGTSMYITTLEKSFYNGECAFNLSPVLTTLAEIGKTKPYTLKVSYTKNGNYNKVGTISSNHIAQGYMCNQGAKYIPLSNSIIVAQNFARGGNRSVDNKTILYLYGDTIPLSFYRNGSQSVTVTIQYRNSAFDLISTDSVTYSNSDTANKLKEMTINLSRSLLNQSFYVDLTVGGKTIRYNVIKPVKATEYYQRISWRNSYGGVSFFDFTGQKSETRSVEIETYQKNIFDYYTDPMNELEKVYDNKIDYNVTLKSHLFENDGKYIFNDLMQSPEVWTEINGEKYAIIIDSVSVDEVERNDIYEASVKYHYSQEPSLI